MRILQALVTVSLMGLLACGGGGQSNPAAPKGNLMVRFGADSVPGFSQAVVSLEKVECSKDGTNWTSVDVKQTFDLRVLQSGHSEVVLPTTSVDPGTYSFRLVWATENYSDATRLAAYVVPTGGSGKPMSMPVITTVTGTMTVSENADAQAQIMLSGQQAVHCYSSSSPQYVFQATSMVFDRSASATLRGHLSAGTTDLSDVEVYAETVDGLGVATIQRRAFTDAQGNYLLEALPIGSIYYVTGQPAGATSSYAALASAPVEADTATIHTVDLSFSSPQAPGSLNLVVTPLSAANQGTWGELRQNLATGSIGSQTLIVRSQTVTSDTDTSQDQTLFQGISPGFYGVTAQRSTSGGALAMTVDTTQHSVSASSTTEVSLSFP